MSSFLSMFLGPANNGAAARASEASRATGAPMPLEQAFASASQATGLPFDYFMTTAMRESSLDVNAAATTSSARGPFQFIEQTWLSMMHQHGASLGLGEEAASIEQRSDGRFTVGDAATREQVLAMRHDPQLSAVMSGLFLMENASDLENALGRNVTVGEGYVAHVFGSSGASRLISLAEQQPNRVAADVFPTAAAANRGLFYDRSGEAVSVRQLYDRLVDGFPSDPIPSNGAASVQLAAVTPAAATPAATTAGDGRPLELEPSGFDDLPQAPPPPPDQLSQLGMFAPDGRSSMPFFAALYRPDGVQVPQLGEEFVSTHGAASQPQTHQATVPSPTVAPNSVGLPLDLLGFVRSGQLAAAYVNPAQTVERTSDSSDLLPPV